MNDPGLDGPIGDASEVMHKVDQQGNSDSDLDEEEEEKNYLQPAKWWYASTAFPLMAGTFGPMANAFSICALVENWRVKIPPGGTEEHGIDIVDPKWLIAVNAVSLVFALLANLSLLLNMARRLRFAIAQPITILGFWSASILLIGLIVKASHDFHKPGVRNQALTQAYYYAIFAASLYQIISYLMCVTVWGAYKGHYSKEFKLTIAQRTLMLQTISFLVYMLLGALIYSKIEGWKFLDAVYWADFTSLTIGLGEPYVPTTHLGRGLLFPFAIGGVVTLGLVVGSIRSLALDRGKVKMAARMTEKTRRKVVKRIAAVKEASKNKKRKVTGLDKTTVTILAKDPNEDDISEVELRRAEFEAMRRVQEMAASERKWVSLGTSTFAFAFLWAMGAFVFWKAEKNQDWSYFESLYFSYTTLLTIGYGDFQPISNSGKPFFVFWSLLAIPTLTILISNMGDTVIKVIKDATIWLGEVTVLPSEKGGMMERLKYGIFKATLGKLKFGNADMENRAGDSEDDADEDYKRFQEMNPGMVKMYPRQDKKHKIGLRHHKKRDEESGAELGAALEASEEREEVKAAERGDEIAEDDHHYRHILISQIRKVWTDTSGSEGKKYSYAEWAYFLRLLGEDENDSRFHRRLPTKSALRGLEQKKKDSAAVEKAEFEKSGQKNAKPAEQGLREDQVTTKDGEKFTKWSWIGPRSPLMGEKDEAEWLLEKLFARLEESLREHWDMHKKNHGRREKHEVDENKNEKENENAKKQSGDRGESSSRQSSSTLDEGGRDLHGIHKETSKEYDESRNRKEHKMEHDTNQAVRDEGEKGEGPAHGESDDIRYQKGIENDTKKDDQAAEKDKKKDD